MKITTLLENTSCRADVVHAHGLSQYVEMSTHKILFDMGPGPAIVDNARALGVDLTLVDTAVLSHAHDDHSGGLAAFLSINKTAQVYLSRAAMGDYYAMDSGKAPIFIGVPEEVKIYENRLTFTGDELEIDDTLRLFSDVKTTDYRSHANDKLKEKQGEEYAMDAFRHEQNLLICEDGKAVLLAGCSHRGVVNILRRAEELLGRSPDAVFAGFHLHNPGTNETEPQELVKSVGRELLARKSTVYYTGHCTGQEAFAILKEQMGNRLHYMTGGGTVVI
ncbi:MBL fold metallo-hydrolase [Oscillibacter sp.]|uniref:MBL fold metallo-hydrolase n=1 Tax=Oscillibacter sp. TaxID=1945593 RepID=UPI0028B203A2|nr:MBL fold metallo-hydrolase [Oscillibacter sp.]